MKATKPSIAVTMPQYKHESKEEAPFKSRFKGWLRAVALIIVLVFVPEQASWAFNYNPAVLWGGDDAQVTSIAPGASTDEVVSARIASSINHLLKQISNQEHTRIQLQLTDNAIANPKENKKNLLIDSNIVFNNNDISSVVTWLKNPDIHPLNCGVFALKDILASFNKDASLEELSVSSLMVDIMRRYCQAGRSKVKNVSLCDQAGYRMRTVWELSAVKLRPNDVVKLQPPFIANFDSEHFVMVKGIHEGTVYYSDIGRSKTMAIDDFVAELSGFALASDLENQKHLAFEYVPDSMQTYIWGNAWVDNSDNLPGLVSGSDIAMSIGIQIGGILFIGRYIRWPWSPRTDGGYWYGIFRNACQSGRFVLHVCFG